VFKQNVNNEIRKRCKVENSDGFFINGLANDNCKTSWFLEYNSNILENIQTYLNIFMYMSFYQIRLISIM